MAQKRIAQRRIIGRHPITGREVLVAAKGRPIPDWYDEPAGEPVVPRPRAAKKKAPVKKIRSSAKKARKKR